MTLSVVIRSEGRGRSPAPHPGLAGAPDGRAGGGGGRRRLERSHRPVLAEAARERVADVLVRHAVRRGPLGRLERRRAGGERATSCCSSTATRWPVPNWFDAISTRHAGPADAWSVAAKPAICAAPASWPIPRPERPRPGEDGRIARLLRRRARRACGSPAARCWRTSPPSTAAPSRASIRAPGRGGCTRSRWTRCANIPDCAVLWAAASRRNQSMARAAFLDAGGFDEDLDINEHRELALRLCAAGGRMAAGRRALGAITSPTAAAGAIRWPRPGWEAVFHAAHPDPGGEAAGGVLGQPRAPEPRPGAEARISSLAELEAAARGETGVDYDAVRGAARPAGAWRRRAGQGRARPRHERAERAIAIEAAAGEPSARPCSPAPSSWPSRLAAATGARLADSAALLAPGAGVSPRRLALVVVILSLLPKSSATRPICRDRGALARASEPTWSGPARRCWSARSFATSRTGGRAEAVRDLERIRRLNRMAAELSHDLGVSVIDIDRAFAHIGGRDAGDRLSAGRARSPPRSPAIPWSGACSRSAWTT